MAFNFSTVTRRSGGGQAGVTRDPRNQDWEPAPPEEPTNPEEPPPPALLPESPVEPPPESPPESDSSEGSSGSGRGSTSDTGQAGGTSATPVAAGSFARPGLRQMAAFNTLAPTGRVTPGGGPGAPYAPPPTFGSDQNGAAQTLDDLLRRLGLIQ